MKLYLWCSWQQHKNCGDIKNQDYRFLFLVLTFVCHWASTFMFVIGEIIEICSVDKIWDSETDELFSLHFQTSVPSGDRNQDRNQYRNNVLGLK